MQTVRTLNTVSRIVIKKQRKLGNVIFYKIFVNEIFLVMKQCGTKYIKIDINQFFLGTSSDGQTAVDSKVPIPHGGGQ